MKKSSNRTKLLTSLFLHFFNVGAIVLGRTYIDLLFLSTYPKSWLPYFFLSQTIIILAVSISFKSLIEKGSNIVNFLLLLSLVATLVLLKPMLAYDLYILPFILTNWIAAILVIFGVISWNTAADAFDVRTFKRQIKWINSAGCVGGLIIGLTIPALINNYGSDSLLFFLISFFIAASICVLLLKSSQKSTKNLQRGTSPQKYPLFRILCVSMFILMIVDTFADYALKSELSAVFSKDEIGKFMGPFYGIINVFSLLIQLFGTHAFLKHFSAAYLLIFLPVFSILSCMGILAHPGLWMAAIFRLGENVIRYSFDNTGTTIIANVLPGQIKRAGKLYINSVVAPLACGVGALFLWLIATPFGLKSVALATIVICLLWLLIIIKMKKDYESTLKENLKIKHFSLNREDLSDYVIEAERNLAIHAIDSKDIESIKFGFRILDNLPPENAPDKALAHFESPQMEIREIAAKVIGRYQDPHIPALLLSRIKVEKSPEVLWRLLESLAENNPDCAISKASELLKAPNPSIRAGAVLVLLAAGDLDALLDAGTALRKMVYNSDTEMRRGAAKVIGSLKSGKLLKELTLLINDHDSEVSIEAIKALSFRKTYELTDELIAKLGYGIQSRYASRTLTSFAMKGADALSRCILQGNYTQSKAAIRTLILIKSEEVERNIKEILVKGDTVIKTEVAKATAFRARRQGVSEQFKTYGRKLLLEEYANILNLYSIEESQKDPFCKNEVSARRKLAETCFLYWFAVTTQPLEVLALIPTLLQNKISGQISGRQATALEFMDAIAPDKDIKTCLGLFEGIIKSQSSPGNLVNLQDPWLEQIFDKSNSCFGENKMDTSNRVMLLRKTSLFENLPGEILLTLAEECIEKEIIEDEIIIKKGDNPDGLYIVMSGSLLVKRNAEIIARLQEGSFFGEIGLLDDTPRFADVIAKTNGTLLYIEKEIFDSITEDLPDVLRAVAKSVIGYLGRQRDFFIMDGKDDDIMQIKIRNNLFSIRDIGADGLTIAAEKEATPLELGENYNFKFDLPGSNGHISGKLFPFEIFEKLYHCEYSEISQENIIKIKIFILDSKRKKLEEEKNSLNPN